MKAKIGDIANVQVGYQFRKKPLPVPDGTHFVLQARDIDRRTFRALPDLARVKPDRDPARYTVRNGDVLFLSKGARNYAALVAGLPPDRPAIGAGYFFILHLKQDAVRAEYLVWAINHPRSQAYLRSTARGSGMPFVPKPAFLALEIEVPPVAAQEQIVTLYALAQRERELLTRLREKRTELIQGICMRAAHKKARSSKE